MYFIYAFLLIIGIVIVIRSYSRYHQLQNDLKVEKRVNDIKLQFFTNISHEIRTPLTRQKLAVELARANPESPDYLDSIEQQCETIDLLLDRLLTLMRLDHAEGEMRFKELDLPGLARSAIANNRLETTVKQQNILLDIQSEEKVQGDQELCTQALQNLLGNAIKYSPAGSNIRIRVHEDSSSVCLSVLDEGPGISEENIGKLTQVFFREDKSRAAATGGYGIGLAVVERIIRLQQGRLTLQNRPEGGFEARLSFPKSTKPGNKKTG